MEEDKEMKLGDTKVIPVNNEKETKVINDVSSIDFMLPEEEGKILEKNLNVYGDLESTQKVLKEAQRNAKIKQNIKDLKLMEKYSDIIDLTQEKKIEMLNIILKPEYFEKLAEKNPESAFKALKSLGDFDKSNMNAREELRRKISGKSSSKKIKIALKFSNDSGEEFELGDDT